MNAEAIIVRYWGEAGEQVINACKSCTTAHMSFDEFLTHCTACGGNWGGMLLTGVRELYPDVWDSIPDDMGCFAWHCILSVLELLGVEMPKDEE